MKIERFLLKLSFMNAIFSYLFYFVVAILAPLQIRWLTKNKNPENKGQINLAFRVTFIRVLFGVGLIAFYPFYISGESKTLILLSLICGIFGGIHFISAYIAQKNVEAGVTNILTNIYTPTTIILATFFLH